MYNPIATYRIQFQKEFDFNAFERIISYLQQLGVGTVYAAPVFDAVPKSMHGYDSTNANAINPEIGNEDQLKRLSKILGAYNIGWMQDIVPNHMAFDVSNPWLLDVLEKGSHSLFATYFDTVWSSSFFKGQIMVPFLGAPLYETIEKGDITLDYLNQRFVLKYFDTPYPLNLRSYVSVLQSSVKKAPAAIRQFTIQFIEAELVNDKKIFAERCNELQLQLAGFFKNAATKAFIEDCLHTVNNNKSLLKKLADEQFYRLCFWQESDSHINYRRFFIVNGLICLNIHDKEVMQQHHALIKKLVDEKIFKALRIDHVDGLYNPEEYLNNLRTLVGDETYITVEKILAKDEQLPSAWPVQGNTGYEFLAWVNNLFTNKKNERVFKAFYQQLTGNTDSIEKQLYDKKSYILYHHMGGELENLFQYFLSLNLVKKDDVAVMRTEDIKTVLAEWLVRCPVYRYYGNDMPLGEEEGNALKNIFEAIKVDRPDLEKAVDLLYKVLLVHPVEMDEDFRDDALNFYQRCMQFTGPLMAKGVEDTLMYTYSNLIAHNEVGDAPDAFGMATKDFHLLMQERQKKWPLSLNATATHDTKRGEDARARLNVLSELPEQWMEKIKEWQQLTAEFKQAGVPNANDEYFIYQALLGAYPLISEDENDFIGRLTEYLQKAFREAKIASNWTKPDEQYEAAIKNFAEKLVDKQSNFFKSFLPFLNSIADFGIVNSLTQVILKCLCPGVPDVYQGCELWDHSFVDPDNRRPVDYALREKYLLQIQKAPSTQALMNNLWLDRNDGAIKLWLLQLLLNERKANAEFFKDAAYVPLKTKGDYKDHILAFGRTDGNQMYIVIVPLQLAGLCKEQNTGIQNFDWKSTAVILPKSTKPSAEDLLHKQTISIDAEICVKDLFKDVPFAIIKSSVSPNPRGAGVLMHISSLPSPFGVGDLGPQAKAFVTFLHSGLQRYWQLLPVNPTQNAQSPSPYSALSAMAGNTLFISPELLAKEGLLNNADLVKYYLPQTEMVDFINAKSNKEELFNIAWLAYLDGKAQHFKKPFEEFCEAEKYWLDDFALYTLLKEQFNGKPWNEWSDEYKNRSETALIVATEKHQAQLQKIKWLQFIFFRQWNELKTFCNEMNVRLMGDLPFYISHDSADVWAAPQYFALDKDANVTAMAGVPPDAFSDDGQLWGMPVYNWALLKKEAYKWWVQRLKKNISMFDLLRLDHFRAFAAYWEVPAGETTAKNGVWKEGPGKSFFKMLELQLGKLPFVAEDLGEIDEPVDRLRDEFGLPGMKVLQFAFGEDMPKSIHIPHNYTPPFFVYTGTHDNNTMKGWFKEQEKTSLKRIESYLGKKLSLFDVNAAMIRLAYASVANTVIVPLQDILGLDETARMNTPATNGGNWQWRLLPGQVTHVHAVELQQLAETYNRF